MTLTELKNALQQAQEVLFELPNGSFVPPHTHLTEVGEITKRFIDCGGTVRTQKIVSLQLWNANDYDHRLSAEKMLNIIKLSEQELQISEAEIEVEVQGHTIETYGLAFNGHHFVLQALHTDCLAKENCGIPAHQLETVSSSCSSSDCC